MKLKETFSQSVILKWLLQELRGETEQYTNFGWLSTKLHESLIVDPRISRKDVKDHVAILFDWVDHCAEIKIKVVEYRHTKGLQCFKN